MYNMKKKLTLFYPTEKEARHYLRHLNYGFILTQNRQGQHILVENVPQLPRVALDNIGIFNKFEMPAEKQEKRFTLPTISDSLNDNLYLGNNPPAMPVQPNRNQPAKARRINFLTSTSSESCNLRNHPYNNRVKPQTKIPTNDVIRLTGCDMASSSNYSLPLLEIPQFSQQLPPLPPVTFQKLPNLPQQQPPLYTPSMTTTVDTQQQQLYNNVSLSIPELSDNRCELPPSTSSVANMMVDNNSIQIQTPVEGARMSTNFQGLVSEELDPNELAEIVEKKITTNIKNYIQLTNTPTLEIRNLYRHYNDPELMYTKKEKMLILDNVLGKLHALDTSVMNNNNNFKYVTDWRRDQHTLTFPGLGDQKFTVNVNIDSTNLSLLNNRTQSLVDNKYMVSMMNNSKIIAPPFMIHSLAVAVKYFLPPTQGFIYRNRVIFPIYNNDPEYSNKYIFYVVPKLKSYTNTVDMDFMVNSNYTSTPTPRLNSTDIKYLSSDPLKDSDEKYESFRRDIEYVKLVVDSFYAQLSQSVNTDFNELNPLFFTRYLESNADFTEARQNTIFDQVGFDIFTHLFEILKSDVHRQFGLGSIFHALLPLPVIFRSTVVDNPDFFGFNISSKTEAYGFNNTVETLASIYTIALFEYFDNQPAPITFCNFYSQFIVPKENIKLENMNKYISFQQKFPRGKLFDTMSMARTNLVHCDGMNAYYWEIVGNYAYVCNIVDDLLYSYGVTIIAQEEEGLHPFKRPFPFNYILGRPVINVYITSVPHIVQIHQVLTSFIQINKEKSLVDQVANGENWSVSQRKQYNIRGINLKIVQDQSNVFLNVDETPFSAQYQQ